MNTGGKHVVNPLLSTVSDAYKVIREHAGGEASARRFKLAILRNFSAEYLVPFIRAYFRRAGIEIDIVLGGFDTVQQDIFTPQFFEGVDLVVLALDLDALAPDWLTGGTYLADLADRIAALASSALERVSVPVIVNSFIRPVDFTAGLTALADPDSADSRIVQANMALHRLAQDHRGKIILIDWERLAIIAGAEDTFDRRMAYVTRSPYKAGFLSAYAYEIFKIGNALRGGTKKCLILDCDNTIWGGVVGEVGADGIALSRNDYPGRAFYDFQRSIVRLAKRGIMVALCSKNNEEDVLAIIDRHPDCLIRREHLVSWRINWTDKERNIADMVAELNIGMDSVVFVDDNPTECARVQQFLPDITVRQAPEKPYLLPSLLDSEGLFDVLTVTEEDRGRTEMYRAEQQRRQSEGAFPSVEAFLGSLELKATITRYRPEHQAQLARVAQLTQKTNQFNLTTRRYSDAEILRFADDPNRLVMGMSVADRFGDFGLTGVLIAEIEGDTARIDSLLLSCRILGRGLERQFAISAIQALKQGWPVQSIAGEYIPTHKNRQVADFWPNLGLAPASETATGVVYRAPIDTLNLDPLPYITVIE